jgi:hypothetical protein
MPATSQCRGFTKMTGVLNVAELVGNSGDGWASQLTTSNSSDAIGQAVFAFTSA